MFSLILSLTLIMMGSEVSLIVIGTLRISVIVTDH
jgi:hypothetical protein